MTPLALSMESIFLILSGVILAAGILYWFWSHIQLTQKKVQLLENAVFELRGMLTGRGGEGTPPGIGEAAAQAQAPAPVPEQTRPYADLADDDWETDAPSDDIPALSTPLEALGGNTVTIVREDAPSDFPAAASAVAEPEKTSEEFRELFLRESQSAAATQGPVTPASLESMPVKELRRLAEQRGITGVSEMRKKELLAALRQQVPAASADSASVAGKLDLTVEQVTGSDEIGTDAIPLE